MPYSEQGLLGRARKQKSEQKSKVSALGFSLTWIATDTRHNSRTNLVQTTFPLFLSTMISASLRSNACAINTRSPLRQSSEYSFFMEHL